MRYMYYSFRPVVLENDACRIFNVARDKLISDMEKTLIVNVDYYTVETGKLKDADLKLIDGSRGDMAITSSGFYKLNEYYNAENEQHVMEIDEEYLRGYYDAALLHLNQVRQK